MQELKIKDEIIAQNEKTITSFQSEIANLLYTFLLDLLHVSYY